MRLAAKAKEIGSACVALRPGFSRQECKFKSETNFALYNLIFTETSPVVLFHLGAAEFIIGQIATQSKHRKKNPLLIQLDLCLDQYENIINIIFIYVANEEKMYTAVNYVYFSGTNST